MFPGSTSVELLAMLEAQLRDSLETVARLKDLTAGPGASKEVGVPLLGRRIFAVVVNGQPRPATEAEARELRPEDYALYLDLTRGDLGCRLPGERPWLRPVREVGLDGVADLLAVMMEHPLLNFGNVNTAEFLPRRRGMTSDAFRKAMGRIRRALQRGARNGPLLLHLDRSHYTVSESGHAWRISKQEGDLCVVRFLGRPPGFRRQGRRRAARGTIG
jgi:hypothetical protein